MKKRLAVLLSILSLGAVALGACTVGGGNSDGDSSSADSSSSASVQIPTGRQYVSRFDKYEDLCLWSNPFSFSNNQEATWWSSWNTVSVNEDSTYIREGEGSMHMATDVMNTTTSSLYKELKTHADNPARGTLTNSIYGAETVSLDVYNASTYTIRVKVTVSTVTTEVMTFEADCQPNQWTTVSAAAASETEAIIDRYRLDITNLDGPHNFELYLDNFYIEFPEE